MNCKLNDCCPHKRNLADPYGGFPRNAYWRFGDEWKEGILDGKRWDIDPLEVGGDCSRWGGLIQICEWDRGIDLEKGERSEDLVTLSVAQHIFKHQLNKFPS